MEHWKCKFEVLPKSSIHEERDNHLLVRDSDHGLACQGEGFDWQLKYCSMGPELVFAIER